MSQLKDEVQPADYDKALNWAVQNCRTSLVAKLLTLGADPNAEGRDPDSNTLFYAAKNAHAEMVRLLLDSGATVISSADTYGYEDDYDPVARNLLIAIKFGMISIVEMLVEAGIDVKKRTRLYEYSDSHHMERLVLPIVMARAALQKDIAEYLARYGAQDIQMCRKLPLEGPSKGLWPRLYAFEQDDDLDW